MVPRNLIRNKIPGKTPYLFRGLIASKSVSSWDRKYMAKVPSPHLPHPWQTLLIDHRTLPSLAFSTQPSKAGITNPSQDALICHSDSSLQGKKLGCRGGHDLRFMVKIKLRFRTESTVGAGDAVVLFLPARSHNHRQMAPPSTSERESLAEA